MFLQLPKFVMMQVVFQVKFMDLALESVVNWVCQKIKSNLLIFLKLLVDLKMLV